MVAVERAGQSATQQRSTDGSGVAIHRGEPASCDASCSLQVRLIVTADWRAGWSQRYDSYDLGLTPLLAVGQERLGQARRYGAADAVGVLVVPFGAVPLQEEDGFARVNTRSGPQLATDVGAGELLHCGAARERGKNRLGGASRGGRRRRRRGRRRLAVGQERLGQSRRCSAADTVGVLGVPFGAVPLQEEDGFARVNTRSGPQVATDVGAGEVLHCGAGWKRGKNRLGRASRGGRRRRRR